MKRPYLVNFSAISSQNLISIRSSITDSYTPLIEKRFRKQNKATTPIQSIGLISSDEYRIKIIGFNQQQEEIYNKEFDSDSFGNFDIKIPRFVLENEIRKLQIFELSYHDGLQLLLGSFIPYVINDERKIVISDFDKTLVDTKYSSPKELYYSLNRPLNYFPTVNNSLDIFKNSLKDNYQPFILSASPHFYENAIRDWLYQNKIYAGNIFLKDYRNFFSFTQGILSAKDLKEQGFYKLNQLVNILSMTRMPKNLILMGDSFESDEFVYLILCSILLRKSDPWQIWKKIKNDKRFNFTTKQDFQFLTKFYQLGELSKSTNDIEIKIFIRCKENNFEESKNKTYEYPVLNELKNLVEFYVA
jgi:hypothetical protein